MGEPKIDQCKIGKVLLGGGDGGIEIVGGGDHPVSRIVLDEIFQRRRKLRVVFDDQDLQHRQALPAPKFG
jgi:hypothetical protein